MRKEFIIILFALVLASCGGKDCSQLQDKYATNPEAVKAITSATFKIKESQTTANSSSIKRVEYYSCDGNKGYLIVYNLSGDILLHKDVPTNIWSELKTAEYMRNYYNDNIKNKFPY